MRYVIIGNGTAAVGAIEGIRVIDHDNPITVISDEPYSTYGRPLISYFFPSVYTADDWSGDGTKSY